MSIIATALKHMLAAGLPPDQIVAAVAEMEAAIPRAESADERRRNKAADRMARYRQNRRENGLTASFSGAQYVEPLRLRDGRLCVYCQEADGDVVDHITPTSIGGTDHIDNLALSCHACNCGKAGRPLGGRYTLKVESAREAHVRFLREHHANGANANNPANNREYVRGDREPPRARREDITYNSVGTRQIDADDCASAHAQTDDWPKGKLAEALSEAVSSPRLDPTKSPGLIISSNCIAAWKREGASWEHDVIPTVKGVCARGRGPISKWTYFDQAILQAIADNRRALELPEARAAPRSMSDIRAAELAESHRLLEIRMAANG